MTIATADTLHAVPGSSYRFYSQARDTLYNLEPAHTSADAQTTVANPALSVGGPVALRLAFEGASPNPATRELHVAFTLPVRAAATLDLIDIAGRRVLRRDVGALGPGRLAVDLGLADEVRPGLYFLRLGQEGRVVDARIAVIR